MRGMATVGNEDHASGGRLFGTTGILVEFPAGEDGGAHGMAPVVVPIWRLPLAGDTSKSALGSQVRRSPARPECVIHCGMFD